MAAKDVAGPGFQFLGRAQQHFAFNRQISPRRTEQIFRLDRQLRQVAQADRLATKIEREINPFRQKVFHKHGFGLQRGGFQIGKNLQRPDAARGIATNRQRKDMAARTAVIHQSAGIFHPIGAFQNRGQWQAFQRFGIGIAGQRGGIDGFSRTVSAAIGGQKHINRGGSFAPFNAAIRQIEFGVGQRQEGQIGIAITRNHQGRSLRASAQSQGGVEFGVALRIGLRGGQHLVGGGQQFNRHARFRRSRTKAAYKDVQAIDARHRRQAQIRHHKPLPACRDHIAIYARNACP
ncbi:MAG: hypothetical protein ACD_54C00632G0001 [uncultured bacterium]|nr:MAG: hypothetical protein ACD_54C00632G0001 [uncultured bacterium]